MMKQRCEWPMSRISQRLPRIHNRTRPRACAAGARAVSMSAFKPEAAMSEQVRNLINGKWQNPKAKDAKKYVRNDPGNGEEVSWYLMSGIEDVNAAVASAKAAFPKWRDLPQPKRGEIIYACAEIAKKRKEDIAQLMTREMGKPIAEA